MAISSLAGPTSQLSQERYQVLLVLVGQVQLLDPLVLVLVVDSALVVKIDHILERRNFSVRVKTLCHEADAVRLYVLGDGPREVGSPGWPTG